MTAKTVCIIEWNWGGHLPGWYGLYVKALLELGHSVVAFCPNPEELSRLLNNLALIDEDGRKRVSVCRAVSCQAPRIRPSRFQSRVDDYYARVSVRKMIAQAESVTRQKISFVFFNCLHESIPDATRKFSKIGRPAGALLLNANNCEGDLRPTNSGDLRGIAVLDKGWAESYRRMCPAFNFVAFPDLVLENTEQFADYSLARKIRAFARGRRVVTLSGVLFPYKGTETFVNLPFRPELQDCFFVLAGELKRDHYSPKALEEVARFQIAAENTLAILSSLDEVTYNTVIEASDIIVAVYDRFQKSSNTIGKAAQYKKPIIVSPDFVMGQRVREFNLGKSSVPGDASAASEAIRSLIDTDFASTPAFSEGCEKYMRAHSFPELVLGFSRLLES